MKDVIKKDLIIITVLLILFGGYYIYKKITYKPDIYEYMEQKNKEIEEKYNNKTQEELMNINPLEDIYDIIENTPYNELYDETKRRYENGYYNK